MSEEKHDRIYYEKRVWRNWREFDNMPEQFRDLEMYVIAMYRGIRMTSCPCSLARNVLYDQLVNINRFAIRDIPEEQRDYKTCKDAVQKNGESLRFVSPSVCDRALCIMAVTEYGGALKWVPMIWRDREMCNIAVNSCGNALPHVPKYLITIELCRTAVADYGSVLFYVPERWRDYKMCKDAVSSDGSALSYVPAQHMTLELCEIAVQNGVYGMPIVPNHLRSRKVCKLAMKNAGLHLPCVPAIHKDEAMCILAVTQCGGAICHVPKHLLNDKICEAAVKNMGIVLGQVPEHLRTPKICAIAVAQDPTAEQYVPKPGKPTKSYQIPPMRTVGRVSASNCERPSFSHKVNIIIGYKSFMETKVAKSTESTAVLPDWLHQSEYELLKDVNNTEVKESEYSKIVNDLADAACKQYAEELDDCNIRAIDYSDFARYVPGAKMVHCYPSDAGGSYHSDNQMVMKIPYENNYLILYKTFSRGSCVVCDEMFKLERYIENMYHDSTKYKEFLVDDLRKRFSFRIFKSRDEMMKWLST